MTSRSTIQATTNALKRMSPWLSAAFLTTSISDDRRYLTRRVPHPSWFCLGGISLGLLCRSRCDHDYADQHQQCSEDGACADSLAAEEVAHQHRHHWIHIRVGAHFGWRFVMDQPDVGGEAHDRPGDDQVQQREPRLAGDRLHMEAR